MDALHRVQANSKTQWVGAFCGALLGILVFVTTANLQILVPSNIAWMDRGDPASYYLAWAYFSHAPWTLPPGANPAYGLEIASSILYSDVVPLMALLLKPFRSVFGEPFQYFGIWMFVCQVLQGVFAWKIAEALKLPLVARVAMTVLLLFVPSRLQRSGMESYSLASHWTILAALYLYISAPRRWGWWWIGLLVIASLVHPYLLAMVTVIWIADLARRLWLGEAATPLILSNALGAIAFVAAALWAAGFFQIRSGYTSGGFGYYRMGLLAPFNANNWSYVLRPIFNGGEGTNYLGLGGLLLLVFSLPVLIGTKTFLVPGKRWIPLIVGLLLLAAFAVSNVVALGSEPIFTVPLPQKLFDFASIFRGSERMFWPVSYVILIASIWLVFRGFGARTGTILIAACALIQVADTHAGWGRSVDKFAKFGPVWASNFNSDFWEKAEPRYRRLRVIPMTFSGQWWGNVGPLALSHGWATDSVYFARADAERLRKAERAASDVLSSGTFDRQALYILDERSARAAWQHLGPDDLLEKVDGFLVLAPGGADLADQLDNGEAIEDIVSKFPVSLAVGFDDHSAGQSYLGSGWYPPEWWGVWSKGTKASLLLKLDGSASGRKLRFSATGFEPADGKKQQAALVFDGVEIADIELGPEPEWFAVNLPGPIDGQQIHVLDFLVRYPTKPRWRFQSSDGRLLGIGLRELIIQ